MLNLCTFSDNLQYKSTLQIKFFACEFLELNRSKSFAAFLVTKRLASRKFVEFQLIIQSLPLFLGIFSTAGMICQMLYRILKQQSSAVNFKIQ